MLNTKLHGKIATIVSIILFLNHFGLPLSSSLGANLAWIKFSKSIIKMEPLSEPSSHFEFAPRFGLRFLRLDAAAAFFYGDCETAGMLFDRAIEMSPSNAMLRFFAGNAYYECGNVDQAITHWRSAQASSYFYLQCEESLHQNRNNDVLTQCGIVVDLDPNLALAFDYLGRAHARLRQNQLAIGFYEKAISLDESIPGLYLRAGGAYEQLGELEIAERYLRAAIEQAPMDSRGYYWLGRIYSKRGNYAEAEEYLKEAIRFDDQQPHYFVMLGDLYCATHNAQKAEANYRLAQSLQPDNANITEKIRGIEARCR